jgi:hypothetical protein
VRFDATLAARLAVARAAVQQEHPAVVVTGASLIRESVAAALHSRRFLRGLGLSARGIAAVTRRA